MSSQRPWRWAPFIEVGVLGFLFALANLLLARRDPGLLAMRPHPTLLLTVLVLSRYGFIAGLVAAGLLAGETVLLAALLARDAQTILFSPELAAPLIVLVPATVLFGMLVQRHIDRLRNAEASARSCRQQSEAGAHELAKLRDTNLRLGEKIVRAESSPVALLSQMKELSALDRDQIDRAILRILVDTLDVEAASIWELRERGLTLRACEGAEPNRPAIDATLDRYFERDVLAAQRVPGLKRRLPLLVGRLRAGARGSVVGYLAVERLALRASGEAARLFPLVVELASRATGNAISFEALAATRNRSVHAELA